MRDNGISLVSLFQADTNSLSKQAGLVTLFILPSPFVVFCVGHDVPNIYPAAIEMNPADDPGVLFEPCLHRAEAFWMPIDEIAHLSPADNTHLSRSFANYISFLRYFQAGFVLNLNPKRL